MMSKPLAVVVVAAAVTGVAIVGTRRMRLDDPSGTSSQTPSDHPIVPGAPVAPPGNIHGPNHGSAPQHNDRVNESNGSTPTTPGGGRTRVIGHRQDRVKNGCYATII